MFKHGDKVVAISTGANKSRPLTLGAVYTVRDYNGKCSLMFLEEVKDFVYNPCHFVMLPSFKTGDAVKILYKPEELGLLDTSTVYTIKETFNEEAMVTLDQIPDKKYHAYIFVLNHPKTTTLKIVPPLPKVTKSLKEIIDLNRDALMLSSVFTDVKLTLYKNDMDALYLVRETQYMFRVFKVVDNKVIPRGEAYVK